MQAGALLRFGCKMARYKMIFGHDFNSKSEKWCSSQTELVEGIWILTKFQQWWSKAIQAVYESAF